MEELDPEWNEMIGNASAPMDEETQLLMEAGIFEDFSFDVLDFDHFAAELVFEKERKKREHGVIIAFIMGVLILVIVVPYHFTNQRLSYCLLVYLLNICFINMNKQRK